ncbi:hypothetical protein ABZ671_18655 [Micromonospora sp. NPDC006766]|uniref:hypothetical protein n=1 Tax=Micromonospora sp. NPDC006766 TaxID=3154778 RepID=UPI0033F5E0EB
MTPEQLEQLARRLRTFTAGAFVVLAKSESIKPTRQLVYLTVHQHADLMLRHPDGYRYTTAGDVAALIVLDRSTVSGHLAALSRTGVIARVDTNGREVGYRPLPEMAAWVG